jgi:hypothetical protein
MVDRMGIVEMSGKSSSPGGQLTIPELLRLRNLGLHFPPSEICDFGGGVRALIPSCVGELEIRNVLEAGEFSSTAGHTTLTYDGLRNTIQNGNSICTLVSLCNTASLNKNKNKKT